MMAKTMVRMATTPATTRTKMQLIRLAMAIVGKGMHVKGAPLLSIFSN
jgi:hypothetical protein